MTTDLDPTLLPALEAIQGALERPRLDRRQLLNSMQRMDFEMRLRHYPAVFADEQDELPRYEQDPRERSFEEVMQDETGIPAFGPID